MRVNGPGFAGKSFEQGTLCCLHPKTHGLRFKVQGFVGTPVGLRLVLNALRFDHRNLGIVGSSC